MTGERVPSMIQWACNRARIGTEARKTPFIKSPPTALRAMVGSREEEEQPVKLIVKAVSVKKTKKAKKNIAIVGTM